MLVDQQIRAELQSPDGLRIEPLDESRIQPASVDLTLDNKFGRFTKPMPGRILDVREPVDQFMHFWEDDELVLGRGSFALASTVERVELPAYLLGRIEGKSSLARLGLFVHVTAGFIDPGFKGWVTLELFNGSPYPIRLIPGMPICQMSFDYSVMERRPEGGWHFPNAWRPYVGKYQDQSDGPQPSQFYKNFHGNS